MPDAEKQCEALLIGLAWTPDTGAAGSARTIEPEWI
jgi:hypothetical protein